MTTRLLNLLTFVIIILQIILSFVNFKVNYIRCKRIKLKKYTPSNSAEYFNMVKVMNIYIKN